MPKAWMPWSAALLIAGCHAQMENHVEHQQLIAQNSVVVVADSSSYAAMNELPVTGGELRLVDVIEIEVEDGEQERAVGFPLRRTDVDADVSDGVAVYTVEQQFDNPYEAPIEAVYVFPLGDEAAVVSYEIVIGERTVAGEIQTREQARQTYEDARQSGHTAALLEQQKANVFAQRVANIPPGVPVRVRFQYVEMLDYADGRYEIAFPTVVGPRYLPRDRRGNSPVAAHRSGRAARVGDQSEGSPGAISVPYDSAENIAAVVSFRARVDTSTPIVDIESRSHELDVDQRSATAIELALSDGDVVPDRDIVIRYTTAGERTQVGLAAHRAEGEAGYFTLVVQPKQSYGEGDIRARDAILLIDVSGSMEGTPLRQAKALAKAVVSTLRDGDVFNVLTFASGTDQLSPRPLRGDAAGRAAGAAWVDAIAAGGATEMEGGVLAALAAPADGDRLRVIYLFSDGFVGNDDVILKAAARTLGHSRIFPVGVGEAPNRNLIDRLAEIGRGAPSYLGLNEPAGPVATELLRRSAYPYLTDLSIDWGGLAIAQVTPAELPDVPAGLPLVIAGRYLAAGSGRVQLTATAAGRRIAIPVDVSLPSTADRPAIRYAWARKRVTELSSASTRAELSEDRLREQITALGLAHHMVTDYTSFVAVDRQRVVDRAGVARTVLQPAAIPAGVNIDTAVGPDPVETVASSGPSPSDSGRGYSGGHSSDGGGFGGGDVDPLTILLLMLMVPAAWAMRRVRAP